MPGGLEREKRRLRRELSAARRRLAPAAREAAGREVARRLAACAEFRGAARVALYAALPDELPTRPCFEAVRASGRTALLPCLRGERGLVFRALAAWEELRPGRYGVPEPPQGGLELAPAAGDLVLVPGVGFDSSGNRLGRGGGVYDAAFPPGTEGPLLFGVGFELQLVPRLPCGPHDRRMHAIVTERRLIRVAAGGGPGGARGEEP
jgi:5-formyltetrahydrofolate cyclo-ligase